MKDRLNFFMIMLIILTPKVWSQNQYVNLKIPDTTAIKGSTIDIPIYIENNIGANIYSYSIQLNYDPAFLQPISVDVAGCISAAFGAPIVNLSTIGSINIATAGISPLIGDGKLLIVKWKIVGCCWTPLNFSGTKNNYINEGNPAINLIQGYISIQNPPEISLNIQNLVLAKGDTVQISAWGGTSPYHWTIVNPDLASIDQNGILIAKNQGITDLLVTDSTGVASSMQRIEIRPFKMYFPSDLTQWKGNTIEIPILVSDLTGLDISSGSFQLTYDSNILTPEDIDVSNTLLSNYQVFIQKSSDHISVAYAGSNPLIGNGIFIKLKFLVDTLNLYGSNLILSNVDFNQNIKALTINGNFQVKTPTYRYVYASTNEALVGDTVACQILGQAIPPFHWTVSDSSLADIDQNGNVYTKKRGLLIVSSTDSAGVKVSSEIKVYDARAFIFDTTVCNLNAIIYYPLILNMVSSPDSIFSIQGKLQFDSTYLQFEGLDTEKAGLKNILADYKINGNTLSFALSTSKGIKTTGTILYFKFIPKTTFQAGSWAGLNVNELKFNEGFPTVFVHRDGSITGIAKIPGQVQILNEGVTPICFGDSVMFHAIAINIPNPQYQWMKNKINIVGATAELLITSGLNSTDSISCKVFTNNPCALDSVSYSNSTAVLVSYPPAQPDKIIGDTVVNRNSIVTYSINPIQNAMNYIWVLPEGMSGNSNSNSISVNIGDIAQTSFIKVFAVNNCGFGRADSLMVKTLITSMNHFSGNEAQLSPNPVTDILKIKLREINKSINIRISDISGREIPLQLTQQLDGFYEINFKDQPKGIYFLQIMTNNKIGLFKIIRK